MEAANMFIVKMMNPGVLYIDRLIEEELHNVQK